MPVQVTLPRSTPEAEGMTSSSILAFLNAVEEAQVELHGLTLVRHGRVVAEGWWEPYAAEKSHMLFSLSKSFTSSAIGMAVAEGRLTVDDSVLSFFPNEAPADVNEHLAAMRVRDLLTMTTGHAVDSTSALWSQPEGNWVKGFFSVPVEHAPGTFFVYNSGATYMLSAILQKLTGETLLTYLTPRLFEPLGIEGATWQSCPRGINVGGWGLKIKTDEIARFGQLYLQQGHWQGAQLIDARWVADATSAQVPNESGDPKQAIDWKQGYGYQFWRCRHNAYRGDGAFGQYCVVMPDQDVVIAINSGLGNMQIVLDAIWDHLLPAMQQAALPADQDLQQLLADRLASLALLPQSGEESTPQIDATIARVSGKSYHFEPNDAGIRSIMLDFDGEGDKEGVQLTLHDARGEHTIVAGYETWKPGETLFEQNPFEVTLRSIATSGAWTSSDTYGMRLSFTETPFIPILTFRFVEDQLEFNLHYNVGFGATERPQLVGQMQKEKVA